MSAGICFWVHWRDWFLFFVVLPSVKLITSSSEHSISLTTDWFAESFGLKCHEQLLLDPVEKLEPGVFAANTVLNCSCLSNSTMTGGEGVHMSTWTLGLGCLECVLLLPREVPLWLNDVPFLIKTQIFATMLSKPSVFSSWNNLFW